jgi:aspartate/methionine/tyrosine aminotransferase
MDDSRIPLDLAFCRWLAVEKGVMMMPCSMFYTSDSPYKTDHYVRVSISRGLDLS